MSNWQPIETAPKDQWILGWSQKRNRVDMWKWDDQKYNKHPKPYCEDAFRMGVCFDREHQPTHWQPLPNPPKGNLDVD